MNNDLKKRIMRRVYAIWFVKQVLPIGLVSLGSLYLALRLTADRFFVAEIMRSFSYVLQYNIWGLPGYIEAALNSVEPSVLLLISIAGIVSFGLAVKLLRSVRAVIGGAPMASPNYLKR